MIEFIIQNIDLEIEICLNSCLQRYDIPVESSNFRNMDGEGNVVQDERVDVVIPKNNQKKLSFIHTCKKNHQPSIHFAI